MISRIRKRYRLRKKFPTCKISRDIKIVGSYNNLSLGANTEIQHGVYFHLGGFKWCEYTGSLTIGEDSIISPNVIIYGCGPAGVKIGSQFDCGPGVVIAASKTKVHNSIIHDFKPVLIGNNVTLYSNVVVSPGANIGSNCVIGANSVVIGHIPDNSLAIGNPAVVVKQNIRFNP